MMPRAELDKLIMRAQRQRATHEVQMLRLTTEIKRLVAERRERYGVCEHGVQLEECWGCRVVEACEAIQRRRASA